MKIFEKFTDKWADVFNWIALVALVLLMCILVIDIIGSKLFHSPIPGSIDILGLIGLFVSGFALAKTQILGNHIKVDFLTTRLPERARNIFNIISSLFTMAIILLIIITCTMYAIMLQNTGGGTQTLEIPFYPFVYILASAFVPLLLLIIIELVHSIKKVSGKWI